MGQKRSTNAVPPFKNTNPFCLVSIYYFLEDLFINILLEMEGIFLKSQVIALPSLFLAGFSACLFNAVKDKKGKRGKSCFVFTKEALHNYFIIYALFLSPTYKP